ncbi:hypothetical protein FGO68_gene9286 [Halteria grandinella]|uniref:DUF637 domain-containing protein n=1 Tax=Halteria grandinella TaxID=5974 RepID=A0A8J8P4S8_HALGN|nr:hypothetical protein FGO68_gene9286 [Halteria grandinella]
MTLISDNQILIVSGQAICLSDINAMASQQIYLDRFPADCLFFNPGIQRPESYQQYYLRNTSDGGQWGCTEEWDSFLYLKRNNKHLSIISSEPSILQAMNKVFLKSKNIKIEGSNLLAGKSLVNNDEIFNEQNSGMTIIPKSVMVRRYLNDGPPTYFLPHLPIVTFTSYNSLIVSGEKIQLKSSSNVVISGDINAPMIEIKCQNFKDAGSASSQIIPSYSQTIYVDLKQFGDKMLDKNFVWNKPSPIKMISAESEIDQTLVTQIKPSGQLVKADIFKSSVDADALDVVIQRAFADYTGCLNYGGYTGKELRDQMLYFAKKINPDKQFSSISEFAANIQAPAIAFMANNLAGALSSQLERHDPILVIPKDCSQYWARNQGMTTNRLAIQAKEDVELSYIKIRVLVDEKDKVIDPSEVVAHIEAGGRITRESVVQRFDINHDGWRGFEDRIIQRHEITVQKGSLQMVAFNGIKQTAVKTQVMEGDLKVVTLGGNFESQPAQLQMEKQKTIRKRGFIFGGSTTTIRIATRNYVPDDISVPKGEVQIVAVTGSQHFQASIVKAANITLQANQNIVIDNVMTEKKESIDVQKSGCFGRKTKIHHSVQNVESKGAVFNADKDIKIEANQVISFTNVSMKAQQIIVKANKIELLQGSNTYFKAFSYQSNDLIWQSVSQTVEEELKFSPNEFEGKLKMLAYKFRLQRVQEQIIPFLETLEKQNPDSEFEIETLEERKEIQHMSQSGPGIGLCLLIALPVGFYAAKFAAALAPSLKGMALTSFKACLAVTSKTFAISLVQNKGDPFKALSDVGSLNTLKSLVFEISSSFLTSQFAKAFDVKCLNSNPQTFKDHLFANMLNQSVKMILNTTINGQNPGQAFQESLKGIFAGTIGSFFASEIGQYYNSGMMSYEMHKLSHASLGAITGAMFSSDPLSDALAGALGSLSAVIYMEAMRDSAVEKIFSMNGEEKKQRLDKETQRQILENMQEEYHMKSEVIATLTSMIFGKNPQVAVNCAHQAVKHNCLVLILQLAVWGLNACGYYEMIEKVVKAGIEQGMDEALKVFGIEIVKFGVMYKVSKFVGPFAEKLLEKCGIRIGVIFESADKVWDKLVEKSSFMQAINKCLQWFQSNCGTLGTKIKQIRQGVAAQAGLHKEGNISAFVQGRIVSAIGVCAVDPLADQIQDRAQQLSQMKQERKSVPSGLKCPLTKEDLNPVQGKQKFSEIPDLTRGKR